MPSADEFRPDWASPPGDTIIDALRERRISESDFCVRIGLRDDELRPLLEGRTTISISIARELKRVLGGSVEFWVCRDIQYRQDAARNLTADKELIRQFPIGDMIRFGWISPPPRPDEEINACCRFFNVAGKAGLAATFARVQQMVAFRTSPSFDSSSGATAVWLRQGEIEADKLRCANLDLDSFAAWLHDARRLTREKDPEKFLRSLQDGSAQCGVAVVVVRCPAGCRASGAARFVSDKKAILQLSFRFLSDDHFWFSFYHEAGHLLLHLQRRLFRDQELYVDGEDSEINGDEEEANDFAAQMLLGRNYKQELSKVRRETRSIIRFARQCGVSPGVVVGQLQHFGLLRQNQFNSLKRRFSWQE